MLNRSKYALWLFLCLLPWPVSAQEQPTQPDFVPLNREVIGARLKQFATTNALRKVKIEKLFEAAGCRGKNLGEQPVKGVALPNVICTLPGTTDSVIVVGAHFDKVLAGKGVVDNWTGAALLPAFFESLKGRPHCHTFVFVSFTAEEKGLIGSHFYARQLTSEQKRKIRGMVNLDSLGLSPTKAWISHADPQLAAALNDTAQKMGLPLERFDVESLGSADSESFAEQKIPSITIHSVTPETFPILHTWRDRLEEVHLTDYYDTYLLVAGYLAFLDLALE